MGKFTPPHMIELDTQNTPEANSPLPGQHTNWVAAHPFTAALFASVALLIFGTAIVISHSAANPTTPAITAWSGDINGTLDPSNTVAGSVTAPNDISRPNVQDNQQYTIPDLKGNPAPPPPTQNNEDSFSYAKFMAGLGSQGTGGGHATGTTDITYAFPPAGLFNAPAPTTERTPVQQALYNYGNEIGSYIQSYEQQHPDQTQTLKNHIEDQNNPAKIQAVVQMGRDLQGIGTSLLAMEDVPPQVTAAHKKLAGSYQTIGKNLALVPQAHGNEALLSAINTYNASADLFAKDFISLVSAFSMYGVTFTAEDAGSVFTFTYSNGM